MASAQSVGEWNLFTRYSGNISDIVESSDMVYYTSGNRLFSFDKKSNETYAYSTKNKLNDINVSFIRYNPAGKYLFIAYDNGNIDLLYDNGRVVNMSDIKDATLTYTKKINTATFANNKIYLGTSFGLVILDDKKHEVVESGIFGVPVQTVFPAESLLFIQTTFNGYELHYAPLDGYHNTLDKFTKLTNFGASWIYPFEGSFIFQYTSNNKLGTYKYRIDQNGNFNVVSITEHDYVPSGQVVLADNFSYVPTSTELVIINNDGTVKETIPLPAALQGQKVATNTGAKSVWGADADGIANYNIENGQVTVLSDKYKPEGISTDEVFFIHFDNTGAMWTGNLGVTHNKAGRDDDLWWTTQRTTRIKDGKPEDMSVLVASADEATAKNRQKSEGTTLMYGGCTNFAVDPENPNRYFQGNNIEGLYVIENRQELHKFFWNNSPFKGNWGSRVQDVQFDQDGNLWVGIWSASAVVSPVWVLPKATLRSKELKDITKDDWLPTKHLGIDAGEKDFRLLICQKSPVVFSYHSKFKNPLFVLKTNNTLANVADDEAFELIKPLDQDGKVWEPVAINCAVEDKNGKVWVGSTEGVIEIADPKSLTEQSRVSRIKVPRNDGTNFADYLCESDFVSQIAVDSSNRKWIATETSGVYLVSENGDEIIEHFTTENSPLPSNQVLSVACDPNSNTVYFGLLSGLISYSSTSSPAAPDYSDIYAYPNPVRPDYTGYITITGLMDNSLVKITDSYGSIVHQTRSEGGMAIWDGFDGSHNPVKSGVYYVFASQGNDGSSESAVTKIMIIR